MISYYGLFMAAVITMASCQETNPGEPAAPPEGPGSVPPFVPPQVPQRPKVPLTPLKVDAGKFAQVDLQPDGGPLRVEAPLTKLHVNRQTGDVNLRAGPVALDLDTAKGGKPFGLWIDIPKIFNLRVGHPADGGKGVNVDIPILRELSEFLRRMQEDTDRQPFPPAVLPPAEGDRPGIFLSDRRGSSTPVPQPASDPNEQNLI